MQFIVSAAKNAGRSNATVSAMTLGAVLIVHAALSAFHYGFCRRTLVYHLVFGRSPSCRAASGILESLELASEAFLGSLVRTALSFSEGLRSAFSGTAGT
jgi:hypothetical protein